MNSRHIDDLYKVSHVRLYHSRQLSRLFSSALDQDFAYYGNDFRRSAKRQNSTSRLMWGSLRSGRLLLGLWHSSALVGYIIGATRPGSDCGDIFWLYVDPAHRAKGLGADLLAEAVAWLRAKQLTAVELVTYDHAPFYERQGFTMERLAEGFIGGQDVYIMKRSLL